MRISFNQPDPQNSPQSADQFTVLARHYDELMQVVPYAEWAEYVMVLLGFVGHQPRRVLDCACGTGNVTFELAAQGLEMTGVDLSAGMIEVAQHKAARSTLLVRFVQGDLTTFNLGQRFDTATCLYDSLNYIIDPAALEAAFAHINAHLEPDGIFVFDMNSVYALSSNLFTQRQRDPRKALHYQWQASYDQQTRICTVSMDFKRHDANGKVENFKEVHRERAYSLEEIERMLRETNWNLLHAFDAYTLNRPHARSERWFFVAQRA